MSEIAIQVSDISKRYRIATEGYSHNTLRDLLVERLKSAFSRNGGPGRSTADFWALKEVSFEIGKGEVVGIIGHNGAGKSTLLKILSQITEPTAGYAVVNGRVGSLLEVGTGFSWELSGRENIYLYGAILGMKKEEIDGKFKAIVAFSELEAFLDTPVKRYSSGMYVRLAFAVAAHLEPEILLLDEVLAVGDLEFQRKCMAHVERLKESNATILFVSHNMFSVKAMCSRAICLAGGQVAFDGPTEEAIDFYENKVRSAKPINLQRTLPPDETRPSVQIADMEIMDERGKTRTVFDYGDRIRIRLKIDSSKPIENPNFIIAFIRSDAVPCCNYSTATDGFHVSRIFGTNTIELLTPPTKLVAEVYTIHVLVRDAKFERLYCIYVGGTFHVRHDLFNTHFGVFHESGEWFLPDDKDEPCRTCGRSLAEKVNGRDRSVG